MIWFDLDNSPHVPLFRPILRELDKSHERYFVTARRFAQTQDLMEFWGLPFQLVGKHAGKNKIKKIINLGQRSFQLAHATRGKNIRLAVSHGSRTQILTASRLGIPSVLMLDYEYTESRIFNYLATHILMPVYIPDQRLRQANFKLGKVIRYNGFKEELYLTDFVPDPNFRSRLGVPDECILVVLRPPAMAGNYHDSKSETLLIEAIRYFSRFENVQCLVVNRTAMERVFIESSVRGVRNLKFLQEAVDGLQLLYAADVAISGGGTMNRESALLGTRTYSIFTGKRPFLDEYLQEMGRLTFIEDKMELEAIKVERFRKKSVYYSKSNLAEEVTHTLLDVQRLHCK